jgi:hypothetical protein
MMPRNNEYLWDLENLSTMLGQRGEIIRAQDLVPSVDIQRAVPKAER